MDERTIVVDLPGTQQLALWGPRGDAPDVHVRRELRGLARGPQLEDETRSLPEAVEIGKTLGEMIAAGVVGNAAWAAFPAAWHYLRSATERERSVESPEALLERVQAVLGGDASAIRLIEAQRLARGGWRAQVERDPDRIEVTLDPSGNIVHWRTTATAMP